MEERVKRKKRFRIWITKQWFEDYEAYSASEAIAQMRESTGEYYFWDIRMI